MWGSTLIVSEKLEKLPFKSWEFLNYKNCYNKCFEFPDSQNEPGLKGFLVPCTNRWSSIFSDWVSLFRRLGLYSSHESKNRLSCRTVPVPLNPYLFKFIKNLFWEKN